MADIITRTHIRLMSGVPFNVDYKHSRHFSTPLEQSNYFDSKPVAYRTSEANFQRVEGRFFFKCPVHIENLDDVNYIRFFNQDGNGVDNKRWYGFITHLEYENKGTTRVYFEIDVLQTFMFEMNFKESYTVREHMTRYINDNKPVINTIDEGLEHGRELEIKKYSPVKNPHGLRYFVIVAKEPLHDAPDDEKASFVIAPQPLSYYYIPFGPDGMNATILQGGEDFSTTPPDRVMDILAGSEDAVNHVVSYYITDSIGIPPKDVRLTDQGSSIIVEYTTVPNEHEMRVVNIGGGSNIQVVYVKRCTEFVPEEFTVSYNYWLEFTAGSDLPPESKLLMSPYHWIELHDYRGGVIRYRPEYIDGEKLTVIRRGSLGLSNKVTYAVRGYNQNTGTTGFDPKTEHEFALFDTNPNDVSVKNEYLAAFLQGNRNQIQNQQNSAITNGAFNALGSMVGVRGAQQAMNPLGEESSMLSGMQGLANTALTIQGIQAKQEDAGNMPPSISKMGNNTAYDFGHGLTGCYVVFKGIKPEYEQTLKDFFRAFGYKSNRFKVPNLNTRAHFNYVETIDCVITGDIPNKYLNELKNVFNKGITLWHTDDIGNYSTANQEVN